MQIFKEVSLFQAMYNIKTEKQTIQLILCQLDLGGWWKEKGTRLKLCVCFSVFVLCIA